MRFRIFFHLKAELHLRLLSKNSGEHWARIGEQVIWSMYSYILGICHHAPNTFSALSNLPNRQILANTLYENQFSPSLVNLCENVWECWRTFGICLFSPILQELVYVRFRVNNFLEKSNIFGESGGKMLATWPFFRRKGHLTLKMKITFFIKT